MNKTGVEVNVYFIDNGVDKISKDSLRTGERWYINSRKQGLKYSCKAKDGTVLGNYSSQLGFRSYNLTYQQPLMTPAVTMEYQSWFTFFNSSPFPMKLMWLLLPGTVCNWPPVLVRPGQTYQV